MDGPRRAAFRLTLEYEGTRFKGWQRQGAAQGVRTVAGEIERVLRAAGLPPLAFVGSGRTDAGVHALAAVAHLHLAADTAPSPEALRDLLAARLPADVAIVAVAPCPARFHARHDALDRTYRYQVCRRPTALARRLAWVVPQPLDLARLAAGWSAFQGFHDVSAFAVVDNEDPRCDVIRCEVAEAGPMVLLRVTASHFLRRQVRRMVGAAVRCGLGAEDPADIARDLAAPTREATQARGPHAAPPEGLFLEGVRYSGDGPDALLEPVPRLG
jgi:tRNA pseudouridine38-40 synthase